MNFFHLTSKTKLSNSGLLGSLFSLKLKPWKQKAEHKSRLLVYHPLLLHDHLVLWHDKNNYQMASYQNILSLKAVLHPQSRGTVALCTPNPEDLSFSNTHPAYNDGFEVSPPPDRELQRHRHHADLTHHRGSSSFRHAGPW